MIGCHEDRATFCAPKPSRGIQEARKTEPACRDFLGVAMAKERVDMFKDEKGIGLCSMRIFILRACLLAASAHENGWPRKWMQSVSPKSIEYYVPRTSQLVKADENVRADAPPEIIPALAIFRCHCLEFA